MSPDDPRRLLILLALLVFAFGGLLGGSLVYAWLWRPALRERRRAVALVIQLRAACAEVRGTLAVKAREIGERSDH